MRTLPVVILCVGLCSILAACSTPPKTENTPIAQGTQPEVGKIVQSTLQAMTAQASPSAPTSSPSPTTTSEGTGSISGSLSYPADNLPSLYVTAYEVGTSNYRYVITSAGQSTFQIDNLQPGTYHVIAYTVGGSGFPAGLAGGYTKAVPCGLATECADHSLIDVTVTAGSTTTGVKPADWFAPSGTFQPFPQMSAVPTNPGTEGTMASPSATNGGIAGNLMYPASGLPALRIVAFQVGSGRYYYTETSEGQSSYEMDNIPAGTYHVVAYVIPGASFSAGLPGGYTKAVLCGLQAACSDHTLIDVVVAAGGVTSGVNPNDYYAPPGTFPASPVP